MPLFTQSTLSNSFIKSKRRRRMMETARTLVTLRIILLKNTLFCDYEKKYIYTYVIEGSKNILQL